MGDAGREGVVDKGKVLVLIHGSCPPGTQTPQQGSASHRGHIPMGLQPSNRLAKLPLVQDIYEF